MDTAIGTKFLPIPGKCTGFSVCCFSFSKEFVRCLIFRHVMKQIVQEALDRLTSSRTTIAIAHRLSTIRNADEICVMHEGRIVERGKHEELIALDGYYKKLNDMQAL